VRTTPVVVSGLTDTTSVHAGDDFVCAVHGTSGQVACWGSDRYGQLGDGTTSATPVLTPQPVPNLANVVELSAGRQSVCARVVPPSPSRPPAVVCWGAGFGSKLTVVGPQDAVQVSTGELTACALMAKPGTIECWGGNGNATTLPGISDAVQVGLGRGYGCAVRSTGEVMCWGANDQGQLGIGTSDTMQHPTPVAVVGLNGAVEVSANWNGTCARNGAGDVVCWGTEYLGGNAGAFAASLITAPGFNVAGVTATTVSTGWEHACAITNSQQVVCWGDDSAGELGDGAVLFSATPVDVAGF
jgi:alpha-tubulin suppressor-like RCC1 family protein